MILDPHKEAVITIGARMSEIIDGTLSISDFTTCEPGDSLQGLYDAIVNACGQALARRMVDGEITLNEAAQVAVDIGNVLRLAHTIYN